MIELLSPAGSPEAVVAAVQNGANAVYLGLEGFNARSGAKNFTQQEFIESVTYCHARGCKVYVTINTLAADRELETIAAMGRFVSDNAADGAIIQDLGVSRVLSSVCPDLPQHASTQMSIHNLAGAVAAAELGMTRVVLARELTYEQIKLITEKSPIETEVFVHGALCFCHSGQCYMSSVIGRRSGNRGACAQPCRLSYHMGRKADSYPLSLKDNSLISHLSKLENAGVKSLKIEGRMKRPEYTAIATRIYAKALFDGAEVAQRDIAELETAFSRDGFTDGYFTGKKDDMFGVRQPADKETQKLYNSVRKGYAEGEVRRVCVSFCATVKKGESVSLTVQTQDGTRVKVFGAKPQEAESLSLTQKSLSDQLYKTGGTQYKCEKVVCELDEGVFLPASAINSLRRQALEELTAKMTVLPNRRTGAFPAQPLGEQKKDCAINIQVTSSDQLNPAIAELDVQNIYVPVEILSAEPKKALPFAEKGKNIVAVLPRVITDTQVAEIGQMLKKARELGVGEALVGNLGHIALAKLGGFEIRGDFGLNVFNSFSMQTLKAAGLKSVTASFELRLAQIRDLIKSVDTEIIAYGRLPLMVTDQCIIKNASGSCNCNAVTKLSDRMGSVFPVMKEFGCRNVIYNSQKLFLADKQEDILGAGLWAQRLYFTTETARECEQIAKSYLGLSEYRPNGLTRGLYYRGVDDRWKETQ